MENTKTLVSKDSVFKRYFWVFVLLAIVAVVVCFNVVPKVAAFSDKPQVENSFNAFIEGFKDTLFDRMLDYYQKFSEFMQPHNSGSQFKTSFVDFIQALAQAMVVLYMLVNMIQEAQKGDPTLDYWTKIFLRTAVAMLMVMMIAQIISSLYDFGGAIIEKAGEGMMQSASEAATRPNKEQWADAIAKLPGMKDVGEILGSGAKGADAEKAAVNWYKLQGVGQISKMLNYIVWFPMGVCIFLMFSAIFEIKIRQLFAPIAVAAISYEGARGSGVRYLKKYLGCLFKIVIYFGIAGIGSSLTLHFLGKIGEDEINVVFALLSNVVAGLAMMQSGGIGDEILGA